MINNNSHFPVTSVYRKKTFTGLLTNYFSFTSHSYQLDLIYTVVDRLAYKINNTWLCFHETHQYTTKESFSSPSGWKYYRIYCYLTLTLQDCNSPASVSDITSTFHFILPYIGTFSNIAQKKVRNFVKRYCNSINIELIFSSFKIGNTFGMKDP